MFFVYLHFVGTLRNPPGSRIFLPFRNKWGKPPARLHLHGPGFHGGEAFQHSGNLTARWLENGGPGLSRCISGLKNGDIPLPW